MDLIKITYYMVRSKNLTVDSFDICLLKYHMVYNVILHLQIIVIDKNRSQ